MRKSWILALALPVAAPAVASEIGQIKVAKGAVQVEREGKRVAAAVGMPIRTADVLVTGTDGSAGVTFSDNSLVSVGPNSVFAIDKYRFDSTTSTPASSSKSDGAGQGGAPRRVTRSARGGKPWPTRWHFR